MFSLLLMMMLLLSLMMVMMMMMMMLLLLMMIMIMMMRARALLRGCEPVDASLVLREAPVSVDVRHSRAYRHDRALNGCLCVEHPKAVLARESAAPEHTPPCVDLRHRTRLSTRVDGF